MADWQEDAIAALTMEARGPESAVQMETARGFLEQAGIPSEAVLREDGENSRHELLVPPGQYMLAISVLDRDYFNPELEPEWELHFAALSDQDLLELDSDLLAAGLLDRAKRLVRTYEDELLKRGLAELESSAGD